MWVGNDAGRQLGSKINREKRSLSFNVEVPVMLYKFFRLVTEIYSFHHQVAGGSGLAGQMPDKLVMGTGSTTVFASRLLGVSKSQLAGAGVAVCQYITGDGLCGG